MTRRVLCLADDETQDRARVAFKKATEDHGLFGDGFASAFNVALEEIFGAYQSEPLGRTGFRFTRLEKEPDGAHPYFELHF